MLYIIESKPVPPIFGRTIRERLEKKIKFNPKLNFIFYSDTFVSPSFYMQFENFDIEDDVLFYCSADETLCFVVTKNKVEIASEFVKGKGKGKRKEAPPGIFRVLSPKEWTESVNIIKNYSISRLSSNGVFFVSPENTIICDDTEIGVDSVIEPYVNITLSKIGRRVKIGQGAYIENCFIDDDVEIRPYSVFTDSKIESGAEIGPFSRLRPGSMISKGARVGNFVEIKNSVLGERTKAQHLSYIGDADVGKDVNIGAGTITCNYDGFRKNKTVISDRVFIGSGCMLVAPLNIGEESYTAAGSTITKDVPAGSLAIERAEFKIVHGWVERKKNDKGKRKEKEGD